MFSLYPTSITLDVKMLFWFLCFTFIIIIIYKYLWTRRGNLPPGPNVLQLLGYALLFRKHPELILNILHRKYGNIVRINLGIKKLLLLNDVVTVKEALVKQGATFSGRPHLFLHKIVFSTKGIIMGDGYIWKQQRYFSVHAIKNFGQSSLENSIMFEVDKLTDYLNENSGKPIHICSIFLIPILNVIWNIVAGKRFKEMDSFLHVYHEFSRDLTSTTGASFLNVLPFLRFLIPKLSKQYNAFLELSARLQEYLNAEVDNHVSNFQENNNTDFIDVYLAETFKRKGTGMKEIPPFERKHLIGTIIDLFIAGVETTDLSMRWALLHIASCPEIQNKVQQELDSVIEKDSFLSISQKSLIPYTEATLLEVHRHPTLVPLSVPHETLTNTNLMGYHIPKGITVLPNLYAMHHDERYWDNPDTFNPERFLDSNGKCIAKHDSFAPFSLGPRACLGESIARLEMHLLFTCLLRRFTFEMIPGEQPPSLKPDAGGLNKPQPFSLIVKPR